MLDGRVWLDFGKSMGEMKGLDRRQTSKSDFRTRLVIIALLTES